MDTRLDEKERQRHRDMILSPYKWPLLYLPLKRPYENMPGYDVAVLRTVTENPDSEFVIDRNMTVHGLPVGTIERIRYKGVDALLDDRWEVD